MDYLKKASKIVGSQRKLALILGVEPMTVTHWKSRGVPANRCRAIEQAVNGQVTCKQLRPDIFEAA